MSRALSNLLEHRAEGATEGWVEDWIDLLDELEFEVEDAIGDANEAYHWYGGMGDPLYALASHPGPHSFGTYRWALSNLESSLKSHTEYVEELAARVKELTADLALMESGTRPDLFEFITLDELEDELATAEEKAEDAARAIEDADPLLDRLTAFVERGEFGAAY
ncbi:MAG: hypothetical protein HOC74_40960 [Gemmatimonadetes bacterium]|nr:hypothetical protein [Gemmatimonadota bacterium]